MTSGYLSKLVGNSEIERFLTQRYPEFLDEFRAIIVASSFDQTVLTANRQQAERCTAEAWLLKTHNLAMEADEMAHCQKIVSI